jgi:FAD/FMN-containing dehydrogenase
MTPERYPSVIYTPESADEVGHLVRNVIPSGQRISVRSGGHNWLGTSLRNDAALINLSKLDDVEIRPDGRHASVGPGATHQMLSDATVRRDLAFPIGHCPTVGLGGYLLSGGMGWNMHTWGPACWNVVAAEVVMADGRRERVDDNRHADLFWALRGGSAGFPGIVTAFALKLHTLPQMVSRSLSFPLPFLHDLLAHVADYLTINPPGLEMALIVRRPPGAPSQDASATLSATAFADTRIEADARIDRAIASLPASDSALADSGNRIAVLNQLEGEGGWLKGPRYFADTTWVAGNMREVGSQVANAISDAPSAASRIVLSFGFVPQSQFDVAFTCFGELTVNFYATWEDPAADELNIKWVRESMKSLAELSLGHYIGESDLSAQPARLLESYPDHKLARLRVVTQTYDPSARLHGFLS